MKVKLIIPENEKLSIKDWVEARLENPFVFSRIQRNLESPPTSVSAGEFWKVMTAAIIE